MATTVRIGPDNGRLLLRTGRKGLAAPAGHDLTIEITRWSGELVLADDVAASTVTITAETGSLRVIEGKGGAIALSERDKREIAATTRRLLDSDHQPEARFTSDKITRTDGDGTVAGTLTLLGQDRPFQMRVSQPGENRFLGTGTVIQSDYGIKPYTAMLGALKLADPVVVEAVIDLSGAGR
ncbi:YceI family protein [Actinocrispum wychmicini]|uniref:Polyisoprenoid-binding protein YceI n=1 Tax=Actinocrispum wychmicini TaxID=1213861 RepID=A0A4R2JYD2_9PSEU|nr:YceI family protein [Actinocrispum wychmicini]TCO62396.1 polyisoprenoid-binding protein YceI [Actinocrispum wychmicini]